MSIWLRRVGKTQYRFLVTSRYLLSRKAWWDVWIGSFRPKIEVFYRPEWAKVGTPHGNEFWVFSKIQNWKLQTVRSQKVDEKNGVICLVSMFPAWVMVLKLSKKKCIFGNFMLNSAINLGLLKQFTYVHLVGLVTHFQKIVLFIMQWLSVFKILLFEIEEFC